MSSRVAVRGWTWLAASAVVAIAIAAVIVAAWDRDDSPETNGLTAEDILHRSEDAMAALPVVRVESISWSMRPGDHGPRHLVYEYAATRYRMLYSSQQGSGGCVVEQLELVPFTERSRGAIAHGQTFAQSRPDRFELLGEAKLDGIDAWIIRYSFEYNGIDSTITVEDTEWIAKGSYQLLRQERDYHDQLGFIGQIVSIIRPADAPAPTCPVTPEHAIDELRPLTKPRVSKAE